jgi:50S ribosomal subunit-associated GTPase HflX
LAAKPEIVALTKIDLLDEPTRATLLEALRARGLEPLAISAATGEGIEALRAVLVARLDAMGLIAESSDRPLPMQDKTEI